MPEMCILHFSFADERKSALLEMLAKSERYWSWLSGQRDNPKTKNPKHFSKSTKFLDPSEAEANVSKEKLPVPASLKANKVLNYSNRNPKFNILSQSSPSGQLKSQPPKLGDPTTQTFLHWSKFDPTAPSQRYIKGKRSPLHNMKINMKTRSEPKLNSNLAALSARHTWT